VQRRQTDRHSQRALVRDKVKARMDCGASNCRYYRCYVQLHRKRRGNLLPTEGMLHRKDSVPYSKQTTHNIQSHVTNTYYEQQTQISLRRITFVAGQHNSSINIQTVHTATKQTNFMRYCSNIMGFAHFIDIVQFNGLKIL